MKNRGLVMTAAVLVFFLSGGTGQAQWVTRDHRWPTRGPWMWALPRELPALYREFNGIDFGHAHLGETLLRTQDQTKVEHARLEVLDFIFSSPTVPPDEEQIAPTMTRMIWEVQKSFNLTHSLHRSAYEVFAADEVKDKDAALEELLQDYLDKPEAITFHMLDLHEKMWSFPESKSFRDKFRKFNTQIWAYHWLQAATYDLQLMGNAERQRQLAPRLIEHYHGYLRNPPVEWQMMPMLEEGAPHFSKRYPELAAIFNNLHMLHDNIDDVLARPDLYPTHEARRTRILEILEIYLHRNHVPEDRYAGYEMKMDGMDGKAMTMTGMDHSGMAMEDSAKEKGMKHEGMEGMGMAMGPRPPSAGEVLGDNVKTHEKAKPSNKIAPKKKKVTSKKSSSAPSGGGSHQGH